MHTRFALPVASACAALSLVAFAPAARAQTETLSNVTFSTPDGGVTTNLYANIVRIHINGTGQSYGTAFNDAFYVYTDQQNNPVTPTNNQDGGYYQLAFSTTTLPTSNVGNDARNSVIGGVPVYSATHDYTFLLNTGVTTPSHLHFGVSDAGFSDNSGFYQITVTAVPEPGSVALLVGLTSVGASLLRKRRAYKFRGCSGQ